MHREALKVKVEYTDQKDSESLGSPLRILLSLSQLLLKATGKSLCWWAKV